MIDSLSRYRRWGTALTTLLVICGTLPAVPLRPARTPFRPPITVASVGQVKELARVEDNVWRIIWRQGGRELALVRWQQPVEIVDGTTFRRIRMLAPGKKIIHFAFHPDPKIVAFSENVKHAEIMHVNTAETFLINAGNDQPGTRFSPDGKLLATGGYGNAAKLWSVPDGKLLRVLSVGDAKGGLTVEFSPDGKLLAVGNRNAYTCLFNVATGKLLRTLDRRMSHGLRFNPAGNILAVVYVDGTLSLWEVATGKELQTAKTLGSERVIRGPGRATELYCVDWSPNGELLVTSGVETPITFWHAQKLSKLKELTADQWINQAGFSPDGSRLITAGGEDQPGGRHSLRVWGLPADSLEGLRTKE